MKEQKLVIQKQSIVSEDELRKAGYIKLADNEQVVKKVKLSREEAELVEKYKDLPFFDHNSDNFSREAFNKSRKYRGDWDKQNDVINRLSQAYFTGYTIKEKKYYIKLQFSNSGCKYLNINKETGRWFFDTKIGDQFHKTQFTQAKINEMQKDSNATGLDLNTLKIEVPENELEV